MYDVVFFLVGVAPASEFNVPMFWNTLFQHHRFVDMVYEDGTGSVIRIVDT
jgi:hypothetical protein